MPKHLESLEASEQHQFKLMWSNDDYRKFAVAKFQSVIRMLEISERLLTINSASIFSVENGHPADVSYPPALIAERIRSDALKYLEGAIAFAAFDRMRRYTYKVDTVESFRVKILRTGEEIPTAKVLFDIGWS